jgi:FkbM family methyltransferase
MTKFLTALKYASLGWDLGVDAHSKWLLASMLPRLKFHDALNMTNRNIYEARVQVAGLKQTVHFREQDIFIFCEVLADNAYVDGDLYERPPACIVDLGAHIGLATLRFAAAFPQATIHCYEPDPQNFNLLKLCTSGLPNAILHQDAVGTTTGTAEFYVNRDRHTASSLRTTKGGAYQKIECRVKPLDSILEDAGSRVDLIKFDIEGVENEVFSHSRRVHEVKHIVGEMKASLSEVEKLRSLFPGHDAKIRQAAKNMYLIHLVLREQPTDYEKSHLHC